MPKSATSTESLTGVGSRLISIVRTLFCRAISGIKAAGQTTLDVPMINAASAERLRNETDSSQIS